MQAIGYSLTWRTRCFIGSGCGSQVFAHTNGDGDFVLFDSLGSPWPVHECYLHRLDVTATSMRMNIFRSRAIPFDGPLTRTWHSITQMQPDLGGPRKRFTLLGTVTNTEPSFIGRSKDFQGLSRMQKEELDRVLDGRRAHVTIVTGEGEEFGALIDLEKMPVRFKDIVAANVKAIPLLNTSAFVVTDVRVFAGGGQRVRRSSAATRHPPMT